jgi:5'-nucleotidase
LEGDRILKILVTNDDGVASTGLWTLVEELKKIAEVVVVVPDREQSGVGTAVTLHQPLRVRPIKPLVAGIETYVVEGTPADSVIIALRMLLKDRVGLLISGINEGSNLGNDVIISGTVGAAFQGYFHGIPALAISVASLEASHFDTAARVGSFLAQQVAAGNLAQRFLLNINVPDLPLDRIGGIELTRLGERSFTDAVRMGQVKEGHDGKRSYYWIVHGAPEWKKGEGTDIWALEQNKISVTPLHSDLTSHDQFTSLEEVCSALMQKLRSTSLA